METFLDTLGLITLILLGAIGLIAGLIAGRIAGRNKALYAVVGIAAALATPFVLAALGIGVLAAGSILVLLLVGLAGAAVVLVLVRMIFGRS